MLKGMIAAFILWYNQRGTIIADPNITAQYTIKRRIYVDVNSPEYDLARDTLVYVGEQYGMAEFTDNGDNGAWAEYQESCRLSNKRITAYRKRMFRV